MKETCVLDVADKDGIDSLEISEILGLTRNRVQQIERMALFKFNANFNKRAEEVLARQHRVGGQILVFLRNHGPSVLKTITRSLRLGHLTTKTILLRLQEAGKVQVKHGPSCTYWKAV